MEHQYEVRTWLLHAGTRQCLCLDSVTRVKKLALPVCVTSLEGDEMVVRILEFPRALVMLWWFSSVVGANLNSNSSYSKMLTAAAGPARCSVAALPWQHQAGGTVAVNRSCRLSS